MKKFIAVPVVLVLVAFGAFAQEVNVGGGVIARTELLQGDNDGNSEITTSGVTPVVRLQMSAEVDTLVGTFGAWLRIQPPSASVSMEGQGIEFKFNPAMWGHVWWSNDMLRLMLGENPPGWWSRDGIARWGFYAMTQDTLSPGFMWGTQVAAKDYDLSFFGGIGSGLLLELTPNKMVNVRVGLPVFDGGKTTDMLGGLAAQVGLNFDFGTIAFTYSGHNCSSSCATSEPDWDFNHNKGSVFAYLNVAAIDNVGIDFGLGAHLENDPVIGIGAALNIGLTPEFALKTRLQAAIDTTENAPIDLLFELLPSYDLTSGVTAFLGAGLELSLPDSGSASLGYYVFPHVRMGSAQGPSLYLGFELRSVSVGENNTAISWRAPVGLNFMF
ncbi:MAG: hypothetical protein FWB79_03430 [Treponema sp.]|nr:hypothetical protein [Treponema sp.]